MEDCDDISEVRGLADVVPPVVGRDFAAATVIRGERSPSNDQTPVSVGVLPADEDMSVEEHDAIVVGDDIVEVGVSADVVPPGWWEKCYRRYCDPGRKQPEE